jgi:hypothetical protein
MSEFEMFLATVLIFGAAAIFAIVRRERRLTEGDQLTGDLHDDTSASRLTAYRAWRMTQTTRGYDVTPR